LKRSATLAAAFSRSRSRGFSMVELVISLVIVLLLSAVAIPTLMNSLREYQLNDAATRVSDLLKFTRFEAVRKNTQVSFWLQANGASNWIVGVDSNGNGVIDPAERQEVITGFATLLPSGGLPPTTPITTALGVGALTTLSGNTGSVTFDARGAIRTGVVSGSPLATNVSIIYIGSTTDGVTPDPQYGFRGVVVLPAGGTQVWTAPPGGTWQRIS
jgi:prepilin-type N-terminal cleavage/methylation domain-containing protein